MPLANQNHSNAGTRTESESRYMSPIVFIGGPTAVGKSQLAVELARKVGGEIVSCDAMQIYREATIASNKPSVELTQKVRHHLIDVASVEDHFDVMQYEQLAKKAILDIIDRKKVPIVVGGTGMYMQVLLDGIFEGPKENPFLRKQLMEELEKKGSDEIYKKLVKLDLDAARKIHPNDAKRVIRALEVIMITGKPISELHQQREGLWGKYPMKLFVLDQDRQQLYANIDVRVDEMFSQGLLDEVKSLLKYKLSKTAAAMIGIKEIHGYLKQEYSLTSAKELIKKNTRNYAKRQLTWFRKDQRFEWIELTTDDNPEKIADNIRLQISNYKQIPNSKPFK